MFRFKHNAPKEKFFFKSMMPRNLSLQNKMLYGQYVHMMSCIKEKQLQIKDILVRSTKMYFVFQRNICVRDSRTRPLDDFIKCTE